jgi:hypothetical protein
MTTVDPNIVGEKRIKKVKLKEKILRADLG